MASAKLAAFISFAVLVLILTSLLLTIGLLNPRPGLVADNFRRLRTGGFGVLGRETDPKLPLAVESNVLVEVPQSNEEVNGSNALKSFPQILLLTPLKQAAGHLEKYFKLLQSLSYPTNKISLGFLVSDSSDKTYEILKKHFQERIQVLENDKMYRRVTLIKQDFKYNPGRSWSDIHSLRNQQDRRTVLAKSRNYLLMSALRPEHDWVLWIDSDVSSYSSTLIEDLISFTGPHEHIIAPNNFWKSEDGKESPYDRNNWQETPESLKFLEETKETVVFEGYSAYNTGRVILGDLRGISENIVKLDGVGGTVLLIRARLHREGLVFLPVPFKKAIETEALGKLALAMGYQPWGLPNYITFH